MWQVTNLKKGWKFKDGTTTNIFCETKLPTGSGVQADIDVKFKPEQLKECMTALKMIPTTAV